MVAPVRWQKIQSMRRSGSMADENHKLQQVLRDFVELATPTDNWAELAPASLAEALALKLQELLNLELVAVCLSGSLFDQSIQAVVGRQPLDKNSLKQWQARLDLLMVECASDSNPHLSLPWTSKEPPPAIARFEHGGNCGLVVARSSVADFPDETSRCLLELAAQQLVQRGVHANAMAEINRGVDARQFRLLFEQAVDGIFVADADGRYVDVNEAACKMLGYRREELVGITIADIVAPEETSRIAHELAMLNGGAPATSEWKLRRKDGSIVIGELVGRQLPDGRYQAIVRDITERRLSEEAFVRLTQRTDKQRRLYETILSNTPDLVYVFDLDHRFTYANQALLNMWGRSWDEAIGKNCLELGYEPWHAAMHDREIEQVILTRAPIRGEVPFDGTNGRRYYDYIFVPVMGAAGEVEAIAGTTRDITDRRRSEEKLRDSRERLQAALNGSGAGTFRWHFQTNAMDWDENIDRLLGLPPGESTQTLDNFVANIHSQERTNVMRCFEQCRVSGEDFKMEFRLALPNGSPRWLSATGKTYFDAQDQPLYMAGMCMDITDRKLAQQLEESQKHVLELIANDAPLADVFSSVTEMIEQQSQSPMRASILVLADDGIHLRHGAAPKLPIEYTQAIDGIAIGPNVGSCGTAAFTKKPVYVSDIANDPLWAGYADLAISHDLRACWSTPIFSRAGVLLGTFAMYYAEVREPNEADLRLVEVATRNVAIAIERRRSEDALRRSDERFRTLADNIPQLAWIADAGTDGQVHWFNKNWFEYTGTTLEEMSGTGWHAVHHPDHAERVIKKFTHHVKEGLDWEDTFPLRGKDNQYRWFLSRMKCIRNEHGEVVRIFGTNTDVTQQREMAEELRRLAAELSESDRRKDDFLATLAHELRNPLAPIRTGLEIMKIAKDDPTTLEETRVTMERQTQQLIALVNDLLDISRITKGKLELRKCRVKLTDVVQSAVEACRPLIADAQHELIVDIPEPTITLDADPNRLAQVLSNLLNNSCKYTPTGGRIRLSAEWHADQVLIKVQDNGLGIPENMRSRIFEMFSQIDRPQEKGYTGLGIGLSLVKSLVEMHGGRIEVKSAGHQMGSEFSVLLPAYVDSPPPNSKQSDPQAAATTQQRKVLIVDDNQAAAKMLSMVVKLLGNQVAIAGDGEQGVEIAADFLPQVILMDIGMPKMNGYEAARHIRQQPWGKSIVLVALTGWGQEEDKQRTKDAGFDYHLVKPAEPAELQSILDACPQSP